MSQQNDDHALPYKERLCRNCNTKHYVVDDGKEGALFDILRTKQPQLGEASQAIHVVEMLEHNMQALKCRIEWEKKERKAAWKRDDENHKAARAQDKLTLKER